MKVEVIIISYHAKVSTSFRMSDPTPTSSVEVGPSISSWPTLRAGTAATSANRSCDFHCDGLRHQPRQHHRAGLVVRTASVANATYLPKNRAMRPPSVEAFAVVANRSHVQR
jgi:hypothetical protein